MSFIVFSLQEALKFTKQFYHPINYAWFENVTFMDLSSILQLPPTFNVVTRIYLNFQCVFL